MKKLILSILAVIFITLVIPLAIVELVPPRHNAESTEPKETATDSVSLSVAVL